MASMLHSLVPLSCVATSVSHISGVDGKDVYLYAGVMTEALQATAFCLMAL